MDFKGFHYLCFLSLGHFSETIPLRPLVFCCFFSHRASDARPYSTDHTITVTVQVYDSNEAPYFPKEIEIIEVPERTEVGM